MSDFRIVPPLAINDSHLVTSNVPEDDAPAWDAQTTYAADERVVSAHRVYESKAGSNQGNTPTAGGDDNWRDIGPTNRWAAFDDLNSTKTQRAGTIDVTLEPGEMVNAVALFGVNADTAQVIVTDIDSGAEVYNATRTLQDTSHVVDWPEYFFEPIERSDRTLFDDIPPYYNTRVRIILDAGAETAAVGVIVLGRQRSLGIHLWGLRFGIQDFSRIERDQFGQLDITQRGYIDVITYQVRVATPAASRAKRILTNQRGRPTVYIGNTDREESIALGLYDDWRVVTQNAKRSDCNIDILGTI